MAARLWAAMASPSEDTISPTYRGCRIHRYGPRSATSRACAITDRLRPRERSDHTAQAVPASSSTSDTPCHTGPGGAPCSRGMTNGIQVATTAAARAVIDLVVARAGPRRR